MSNLRIKDQWRIYTLLALMLCGLRLVVANCGTNCTTVVGSSFAQVVVGESIWYSGGCPASTTFPTVTNAPITCPIDVSGIATASAGHYTGCSPEAQTTVCGGPPTIDVGKTECKYSIFTNDCGSYAFTLSEPKKSGVVTITITVSGDCPGCGTGGSQTWTATGYVEYQLSDDGGCSQCNNGPPSLGSGSVFTDKENSANLRLNLGLSSPGLNAGFMALNGSNPSPSLAQPSALTVPFSRPGVEVIRGTNNAIAQVMTAQGLVNVALSNSYAYDVQVFYAANVTPKNNGFYGTNAPAFVTWTVRNPDEGSATNHLWIAENRSGNLRSFQFTYNASTLRWDLLEPDAVTTNSSWMVADTDPTITNYFNQVSVSGQVFKKVQEKRQYVSGLPYTLVLQSTEGDGNLTQTTTNTYYSSSPTNGLSTNLLQRIDYPDGNWVYYQYDPLGRKSVEYSAYNNNTPPAAGAVPNPPSDACKVTYYAYTLTSDPGQPDDDGTADDGSIRPAEPRRIIVKIPVNGAMQEISRKYHHIIDDTHEEDQECADPGALWGASGNLRTITYKYSGGKLQSISRPDGTALFYSYPDDFTTVEQSGQPDYYEQPSYISTGTQTTTVVDDLGVILSRTNLALASGVAGIVLEAQTYNYKDANNNYLDQLRRSYTVTDLAGRTTQYWYDCCGLNTVTNSDGATTYYEYDALKRTVGSKRVVNNVQQLLETTNILDGAGRVLQTRRVGTDGTSIIQYQALYDVLGRLMRETNALNGVSIYTNIIDASSQTIKTNTYADGGTRIEFYARDGRLAKLLGSAVAPVRYLYDAEQDSGIYRAYTKEIKLNSDGSDSSQWTKTYSDGAGRSYKTAYAPRPSDNGVSPYSQSFYNANGQVWKERDPDNVVTLYTYDSQARREYTIVAVLAWTRDTTDYPTLLANLSTITSSAGTDRITQVEQSNVAAAGSMPDLTEVDTYVFDTGQSTGSLVSKVQRSTSTLKTWNTVYRDATTAVTTSTVSVPGTSRTETSTAPDGTQTINQYQYGRLVTVTVSNATLGIITSTSLGYDAHNRRSTATDARNGTTSYTYNNADQVATVVTPAPASGQSAQTTATSYDTMLRVVQVTQPDGTVVTNQYATTGLLTNTCGSRTYPVGYAYDSQGRMTNMTTWTNYGARTGAATTTWNYNAYRGWLDSKRYADNTGPDYTYTAGGRLASRTWARTNGVGQRVLTSYSYGFNDGTSDNEYGDLVGVSYSNDPQNTTALAYNYDRRGRQTTISRGGATTTKAFDNANELLAESYSGGTLAGLAVTNGYDTYLRRTKSVLLNPSSAVLASATLAYDAASRLQSVTDANNNSAAYVYLANSLLISNITFKQAGTTRMATTRQYDFLNRLTQVSSAPTAASSSSFNYAYDSANQRVRASLCDNSYWVYVYDGLGQVVSGHKFFADETLVAGQQFDYSFDTIGNRTQAKAGGDQNGANQRVSNYTLNAQLNQYTQRTVPGYVEVMGLGFATNTVTVNGQTAYRKGEYFRQQLAVTNSTTALWTNITVSDGQTSVGGNQFVAKAVEPFSYDLDGNLLSDGRWNYGWDAENRLIALTNNTSVGPQQVLHFEYDAQGRRIHKQVYPSGSGTATNDVKFIYDGWNLVGELTTANTAVRTYLWGLDLSGSGQGAGGVSGLIEVSYSGSSTTNCFAAFDGNGNVGALVNAADGTSVGQYEYGPFGEVIRATGPMAKANPFRFSSKYQDDETDLVYYGRRYYTPSTGRWLSRDPREERGGVNLFAFVSNDPTDYVDPLGLMTWGEMTALMDRLEAIVSKQHCCCMSTKADVSVSFNGTASRSQVTMTLDVKKNACVEKVYYFWWDCFSAQREYGHWFGSESAWQDYGWRSGGPSITASETGSEEHWWDIGDAHHWNWMAQVFYVYCGKDGYKHVGSRWSGGALMWTWSNGAWTGPEDGGGNKRL